jgi:hypothetical protein
MKFSHDFHVGTFVSMGWVRSPAVVEGVHELSHAAVVNSRKDVTSKEEGTDRAGVKPF